jgi:DNA-binding NarL/FixJ family response regulator
LCFLHGPESFAPGVWAISAPGRLGRIKVLAAESAGMNGQLLAAALAQDRQVEVIGVEPKLPSILAAVAQQRPHVVLISSAFEDSGTQSFDLARQISAAGKGTRVIFLMDTSSPANVVQAFRCGAHWDFLSCGILEKSRQVHS